MSQFRLIEAYSNDPHAETGFPTQCLIEDEDGIRILVWNAAHVPVRTWVSAHAAGCSAILIPDYPAWVYVEDFIENREEDGDSFVLPPSHFWKVPGNKAHGLRSYREMRQQERTAKVEGFVHLHAHSEFSALDGLSSVKEMVKAAADDGQRALAITDHGKCASHPHLQIECDKAGIKPIFGIEAYFVPDRLERPMPKADYEGAEEHGLESYEEATKRIRSYSHLILWAMDDEGLRNLWAMSTEANRDGFYYYPRLDWETLEKFNKGVMASTACLGGPLSKMLLNGDFAGATAVTSRLSSIFDDRLYLELHTNKIEDQYKLNWRLVELSKQMNLPLIVVTDSHYATADDADTHRVWLAAQTNKDVSEDTYLFAGDTDYHMMTESEVRESIGYLDPQVVDEAVGNTVHIANRCTARITGKTAPPVFSKKPTREESVAQDVSRLVDACLGNWELKVQGKEKPEAEYAARFEREMRLLIDKDFCGYFLMVRDYCKWAREHGILVGPGRGSGGGSLVAYLSDITEIDPVDADLLFERFLTEGRTSLPDFDVDFPASKRKELESYVRDKYGEDHVVRVGTHIRLKNKGAVKDLARVLKSTMDVDYKDLEEVSKIIDEAEADKAGLGMSWEDLWADSGDKLAPYREKYPDLFNYSDRIVNRLKSYGKHAAGVCISAEEPLIDRLPLRNGEDGELIAEWDMDALEAVGLVKFDLLTLRTLDTIQMTVDLIKEQLNETVNVYGWKEEYNDEIVWKQLGEGRTLGVFQIETPSGTSMTKKFKPENIHDLADVITLVRPGPMRSGLTATYLRRRNGDEPVTYPEPRLENVLGKTYGCLLYQEDIMATCMTLAGYDSNEADAVRKILGKKKIEAVAEAGHKFVRRCVENNTDEQVAFHLWEQMAEFAKYSFNQAHAYGYAVLGYWCAWLKFHYPLQFLAAALSTVDEARYPEFINDARRMGYKVLPPDINESGHGFIVVGEGVRYGLDSVKGVGAKAVAALQERQPFASWDDFTERGLGGAVNSGVVKTLARVGAFDGVYQNRRKLETSLEWTDSKDSTTCGWTDTSVLGPNGLPCSFDWTTEPVELTPKGKPKKQKPLPKRCTKACRRYKAPTLDMDNIAPYTDAEIRDREMDLLGVYLSSTPFDVLPPDVVEQCAQIDELEGGEVGETFTIAGLVSRIKPYEARNGQMAFTSWTIFTEDIEVVVFANDWAAYRQDLKVGKLYLARVKKNQKGFEFLAAHPVIA